MEKLDLKWNVVACGQFPRIRLIDAEHIYVAV